MNIAAGERHLQRTDLLQGQMRAHFPNLVVKIAGEDALRAKIDFSHAETVTYRKIVVGGIAGRVSICAVSKAVLYEASV